jgi:hypothetical protein
VRVTEALVENLAASEHGPVVAISGQMGNIADIDSPNDSASRSSKAALNATVKGMGGESAPVAPACSGRLCALGGIFL